MNTLLSNFKNKDKLFLRVVLIPAVVVFVYLYIFMPDRYESTALVSIKDTGAAQIQTGVLASLGVQGTNSSEDQQLLQAYIGSKAFALALDKELELKTHYANSWDFIFGIGETVTLETYFDFYRKHIRINKDVDTGLLAIQIQAYTPEFSKNLADTILQKSEQFINDTGKIIAESEMSFALAEIERNQNKLKVAKSALLNFQDKHNLVSPDTEGESLLTIIFELEGELAKVEAELNQSRSYLNAGAPKIKVLESRASALQKEINTQKRRIIGEEVEQGKLNTLTSHYQNYLLDVELAATLYSRALSAYEIARVQASKQLKYLIVASEPQLAEEALYPKRLYWLVTMMVFLMLLFFTIKLSFSVVKEHKD